MVRALAATVLAVALVPGPGTAAGDLAGLFAGRTVDWTWGEQRFQPNGRTRDRLFRDRHGWWEARGDALCFLWPPREDWECVSVTLGPGAAVRFEFPDGTVYAGAFRE